MDNKARSMNKNYKMNTRKKNRRKIKALKYPIFPISKKSNQSHPNTLLTLDTIISKSKSNRNMSLRNKSIIIVALGKPMILTVLTGNKIIMQLRMNMQKNTKA